MDNEETRQADPQALPSYEKAVILPEKLEGYALNPTHDAGMSKARVFKSVLGFGHDDWELLRERIFNELPFHAAKLKSEGLHGKKYELILPIEGPNQVTANVITIWIIRPETDFPSLVTAYVAKK